MSDSNRPTPDIFRDIDSRPLHQALVSLLYHELRLRQLSRIVEDVEPNLTKEIKT